jgi:RES domain-containing protein
VLRAQHRLVEVLSTLPCIRVAGPWARAVADRYLQGPPPGAPAGTPPSPLWWPGGAPRTGQRFTPRGAFPSLYLADNGATALAEVEAILTVPGPGLQATAHAPFTILSVEGELRAIVDLTTVAVQRALHTSEDELVAPWRLAQQRFLAGTRRLLPPTQRLGAAAFATGTIAGLRYPSAKFPGAVNLVVFTDRLSLDPGNALRVVDPTGRLRDQLP